MFRPHDLLWVDDPAALKAVDALPDWATPAWLAVAPAVVRRAAIVAGSVPAGLRGATRSERCAVHVQSAHIVRVVTPEQVARRAASFAARFAGAPLACLRTLARIASPLDDLASGWGVTGSVGFTLASGFDVLRADSDLDLLLRAPDRADATALRAAAALAAAAECRVDIQVETAHGAFALNEWLRTGGPVLLKTADGPLLCEDPWHPTNAHSTLTS